MMATLKDFRPLGAGTAGLMALVLALAAAAPASAACKNRGNLDVRFCDDNGDLVADTPTDKGKLLDPSTLIFSYTPVEDPSVYENVFTEFMTYLSKKTGKRVKWYGAESYAAQVEAMRSGRLHVAGISTGPTVFGVNLAGYVPFSIMGKTGGKIGSAIGCNSSPTKAPISSKVARTSRAARSPMSRRPRTRATRRLELYSRTWAWSPGQGLQSDLFRQARQFDHGCGQQGLRRRPGGLERA